MKKVKIEVMLQGYGDSHFATSVEEIIEVDDNAPIDDFWAKRIYVEEVTTTDKLSVEKLQEQLNSKVKALTEEIESIEKYLDKYGMSSYGANTRQAYLEGLRKALASIGGDDDENRL